MVNLSVFIKKICQDWRPEKIKFIIMKVELTLSEVLQTQELWILVDLKSNTVL